MTSDWDIWTTRYLRVHCEKPEMIDQFSLDYADRYIDSLANLLHIPEDRRLLLEDKKIDYYVIPPDDLEEMMGMPLYGVALQSFNSVISVYLPHTHELAHALIEFALKDSPRGGFPFVTEGIATALGGRLHASPAVALQLGEHMTDYDKSIFDRLLPAADHMERYGSRMLSYSAGAVFADCLFKELGADGFLDMYKRIAMRDDDTVTLDRVDVMDSLEGILGGSYDRFVEECHESATGLKHSSIRPLVNLPKNEPDAHSVTPSFTVSVWETDSQYIFVVDADGKQSAGTFLFDCNDADHSHPFESLLFNVQYDADDYNGECLGLRFTPFSVTLYNYRYDRIEAAYLAGTHIMTPVWDDTAKDLRYEKQVYVGSIWNEDSGTIRFMIEKRLIPGDVIGKFGGLSER